MKMERSVNESFSLSNAGCHEKKRRRHRHEIRLQEGDLGI